MLATFTVIALSRDLANKLAQIFLSLASKIYIISNSIDPFFFRQLSKFDVSQLREMFGNPRYLILSVSKFEWKEGVGLLIKACSLLIKRKITEREYNWNLIVNKTLHVYEKSLEN